MNGGINFAAGDRVIPNEGYALKTFSKATKTRTRIKALHTLEALIDTPSRVTAVGSTTFPVRSFIRVVPNDTSHVHYNDGLGVVLFFHTSSELNACFELSNSYLSDKCYLQVLNNSGVPISKNDLVYQTGFDTTTQLATVALASADAETTSVFLGAAMEDIADTATGTILTSGSFQYDTSSFSINDKVYLGSAGAISATAGTIEVTVGTVLSSSTTGSITISSSVQSGGTGGDGTGKQTIWIPAAAMSPTVTAGCAVLTSVETTAGNPDLVVLDFDASSDEHAQFQVAFPKQWDKGTVTFQAFWTLSAANTDGVAWALQAVAVSNDEAIDVAYGTPIVITDVNLSASNDQLVTAESAALTIAGSPADDDMTYFRVFRDVSDSADTATGDGRLIGIKLFFSNLRTTDD
jgi:hypothetical protein